MLSRLIVLLALLLNSSAALGMSCKPLSPKEHIDWYPIIFFGQVMDHVKPDGKERTAKFEVMRAYKGVTAKTIIITYVNDGGGNWGWGFDPLRPVLVFANRTPAKEGESATASVDYCSMIRYHGSTHLHWQYWDLLSRMN